MTCDARIRPMRPINETEILCQEPFYHLEHSGTIRDYAYPGSETKVNWMEDDRRNYHGEWPGDCLGDCLGIFPHCLLPNLHRGGHVQ